MCVNLVQSFSFSYLFLTLCEIFIICSDITRRISFSGGGHIGELKVLLVLVSVDKNNSTKNT